jgi:hypothetical protein
MSIKWELNEPIPNYLWNEAAKMSVGCLFDRYRNRSRSFVISTIGEIIKSIKKDDVIPPLSDTKTMPELAKQCQNARVKYVLSRNFVISGEIT